MLCQPELIQERRHLSASCLLLLLLLLPLPLLLRLRLDRCPGTRRRRHCCCRCRCRRPVLFIQHREQLCLRRLRSRLRRCVRLFQQPPRLCRQLLQLRVARRSSQQLCQKLGRLPVLPLGQELLRLLPPCLDCPVVFQLLEQRHHRIMTLCMCKLLSGTRCETVYTSSLCRHIAPRPMQHLRALQVPVPAGIEEGCSPSSALASISRSIPTSAVSSHSKTSARPSCTAACSAVWPWQVIAVTSHSARSAAPSCTQDTRGSRPKGRLSFRPRPASPAVAASRPQPSAATLPPPRGVTCSAVSPVLSTAATSHPARCSA